MCRWWKIRSYRLWIPSRLFCASTDSIRRIGCCGSTAFGELLDEGQPDFDPLLDPKCCWALRHPDFFPVEVNRADYEALLRVPGIGVVSAKRILVARRGGALRAEDLKKLGVVLKRAQYFLTCSGRSTAPLRLSLEGVRRNLTATERASLSAGPLDQLSLFEPA